jgi:myo-inositol 2-dehydrogenase/D-chiro-inositol 1-dehydrogenase
MIRIAQLGAGRMGAIHARNAAANSRLDLALIADPRADAARALADQVGARVADLEAILGDPSIAAVIVASSTSAHLEGALACLDAGKAVFCEKPLDLSLASLRAAAPRFAAAKSPLYVAFNRRFDPQYQALKARLDAGEIGTLESLCLISHDPAAPPPDFIPTSGGLFRDFTIHDFDIARWLLPEEPSELFAWASCLVDPAIGEAGDVDTARIILRTPSGRLCTISNTRRSGYGYDQRVEAYGERGALAMGNVRVDTTQVWTEGGANAAPIHLGFLTRYADAYRREMDHFADVLEGKAPPMTGYDASLRALALAEAAGESASSGKAVRLAA